MNFNASNYTILVVDDIQSNVLLMKALLKQESYNFVSAMSGEEALEVIEESNPDLVLLDVMMPGLNGFQVAEIIRQNPETADLPIIFLTALGDSMSLAEGFSKGASDYISKPFQKEELFSRVKYQLMLRDAYRQIREQSEELESMSLKFPEVKACVNNISATASTITEKLKSESVSPELRRLIEGMVVNSERIAEFI